MEGLGLLAWYSSGEKKTTTKKDETGNEQIKINQSIKRYYLNIVMSINVLKHWERSSEQLYKTQNECIIKAVTILQIFWPLVCWKMAVQTVWNPVCHPCLPLDKKKRKEKICRSIGLYPQLTESNPLWRQSCFGSSHFLKSSIVIVVL